MKKRLIHFGVEFLALFVTLILPGLYYASVSGCFDGSADAVSSASIKVPDQPSGEYTILINKNRHSETLADWEAFFTEQPVGVIMEDISCIVAQGDANGYELADRYRIRLAANQMSLRAENGTLLVSKAENSLFDVIILSKEMADYYGYGEAASRKDVACFTVVGKEAQP